MPPLFPCAAYRVETVVIGAAITILATTPASKARAQARVETRRFGVDQA
jgi:hypothetical protein